MNLNMFGDPEIECAAFRLQVLQLLGQIAFCAKVLTTIAAGVVTTVVVLVAIYH